MCCLITILLSENQSKSQHTKMKIAILYNKVSENAADDESDVLDQVELVENNLIKLDTQLSIYR